MQIWLAGEASLDELLSDEIMGLVVASAGMNREQLRSGLTEMARRLGACVRQGRGVQGGETPRQGALGG
jgi:hypothetical protein